MEKNKLPRFSQLEQTHFLPELKNLLTQIQADIQQALKTEAPDETFVQQIEDLQEQLNTFWHPIEALNATAANPALATIYEQCLMHLTQYYNQLQHNQSLYLAFEKLGEQQFSDAVNAFIKQTRRDFKLAGIALNKEKQKEFNALNEQLAKDQHQFSENVRLSSEAFMLPIPDESMLADVPTMTKNICRALAKQENLPGYAANLDLPLYVSLMQTASNRVLKKSLYYAFSTRASSLCEDKTHDNSALMVKILQARQKQASLLGFSHYAEYSLATKMADNSQAVLDFLYRLVEKVKPKAAQEWETLKTFAAKTAAHPFDVYDAPYYSEQLKQATFQISNEKIRAYFPANKVIDGVFSTVEKLFAIRFKEIPDADCIHERVKLFELTDMKDKNIGYLYVDLYTRKGKRGGAWMADCYNRHRYADGSLQKPVAFLNCNFSPPTTDQAALLTHDDVLTLFHELGHCLHHLLTEVELSSVAGINGVAWDAVELPSQFLENWGWASEIIETLSSHHETGEPLPKDLFEKLKASRNFQSGLKLLRQLEFAVFDFELHVNTNIQTPEDIQTLLNKVRQKIAVTMPPDYNRFQHSFCHIFAGGYAAGYYSYLWAEVLSLDAFSAFKKHGLFDPKLSQKFRQTILANGSVKPMGQLIQEFLGRPPSQAALLAHYELSDAEHATSS